MANLSTQERQELAMQLPWQQTASIIISDERTPTTNYESEITPSTALLELTGFTEKELDELLFMEDFKQHEVNIITTTKKHPSIALNPSFTTEPSTKAPHRIFAKAVSTKQIDETVQKMCQRKHKKEVAAVFASTQQIKKDENTYVPFDTRSHKISWFTVDALL